MRRWDLVLSSRSRARFLAKALPKPPRRDPLRTGQDFAIAGLAGWGVLLSACSGEDALPPPPSGPPAWQVVLEGTPGALLRAHGTNSKDVWIVGADADGQGPLVYHYDGQRLRKHETGTTGDLWWVQADLADDEIRMVGERGRVVQYRPSTGQFTERSAPTTDTIFGVWGTGSSSAWYVGGETSTNRGVIWRDDGTTISAPTPLPVATSSATFFKAQGFGANAVWMVGQRGRALFFDGQAITETPTPTFLPLIAVHGRSADQVYAVGGVADGVILRREGQVWVDETPRGLPQMSGIWVTPDGTAYAAGFNGHLYVRKDGAWSEFEAPPTFQDFHAIWVDDQGGIWAVGGRLAADPPRDGVLVYYGPPLPEGIGP